MLPWTIVTARLGLAEGLCLISGNAYFCRYSVHQLLFHICIRVISLLLPSASIFLQVFRCVPEEILCLFQCICIYHGIGGPNGFSTQKWQIKFSLWLSKSPADFLDTFIKFWQKGGRDFPLPSYTSHQWKCECNCLICLQCCTLWRAPIQVLTIPDPA